MKKCIVNLKLSIKKKLLIVATFLLVAPTLFLGITSYRYAKVELDKKGQTILKNAVNSAIELISQKQQEVLEGKVSLEEAQEQVKISLIGKKNSDGVTREISTNIDLGKNGYFAVYNKEGYEVAHPLLEGRYVLNEASKSKDKLHLVRDCIEKADNGGGFTYYYWQVPKSNVVERKIAYTALDTNWGWYLSASSYMSSFNSGAEKIWKGLILTLITAISIGAVIIIIFAKDIAVPIIELGDFVLAIKEGNYGACMAKGILKRKDEIGMLARATESMNKQLIESFEKLYSQNNVLENEIKERKKAELRLSITYEVIENSKEAIFIADSKLRFIYINKSFSRLTGYSEEETLNRRINEVARNNTNIYTEVTEQLNENGAWSGEFYEVNKDGQRYPVFLSIKSIKSEHSNEVHYIGIFEDLTLLKANEENINYLKKYDALTGLPQKSIFIEKLDRIINEGKSKNKIIGVMTLGLDDFKFINEAMGHLSGDTLLFQLSERLREYIKNNDDLARITGDEFAIILDNITKIHQITDMANRILGIFSKPFIIQGKEIFVTASIGISIYPVDGSQAEVLIMNATSAQNHVKKNGKNNYQLYSKKMNEDAYETLEMITSLRHAIDKEEFILHYQPQVNLATGNITGMEALIRWNHPTLGLLYPDKFISLAEKTGMIVPMSEWVLKEACEQNKRWHNKGYDNLLVAVNLSAIQFKKKDLAKKIKEILETTKISPKFLEIEITEGILMENVEQAIEVLSELKEIGVNIAIDDFGTGYSSLNYLRQFPIDRLKIDRSFIMGIPDIDNGSIANIIIELAKSLNLKVIAEGVETIEHLKFLKERNCDEMQGYYFSKPLSVDKINCMLSNDNRLE